jgi:putative endonuclease
MPRRTPPVRQRWHVYVLRLPNGALYTGIALDVAARIAAHAAGAGAKSLRGRTPLRLVLAAPVGPRGLALRVEARIKRLRKADKERLVADPKLTAGVLRAARATRLARRARQRPASPSTTTG